MDAITPIPATHWQAADFFNQDPKAPDLTYAQRGGFLPTLNFNPLEYGIAPKDIEATDTTQLFGMVAAKQALADAGYADKPFNKERTSVILGVTGALELVIPLGARLGHPIWRRALKEAGIEGEVAEDVVQRISDGYVPWQENSFPGLLGNVAAGRIAARLDLGGTNCVVDAACASSMAALHLAALELETGRADMVITGGVDTFNDIFMYMCFSKTPALSPTGDAKPFDKTATAPSSAKASACSCSSASLTPSATATRFTASSKASAPRATAVAARFTNRAPKASRTPCAGPTPPPMRRRRPLTSSKPTALAQR